MSIFVGSKKREFLYRKVKRGSMTRFSRIEEIRILNFRKTREISRGTPPRANPRIFVGQARKDGCRRDGFERDEIITTCAT